MRWEIDSVETVATTIITVSPPHIYISLYHSFFSLTLSLSLALVNPSHHHLLSVTSLSSFNPSLLPHRIYHSFSMCSCGTEVPYFSRCLCDHLKSFTICLTLSIWNSPKFLTLSLFLFIIFYLYFYLFDNKSLCLSLLSFPSLSYFHCNSLLHTSSNSISLCIFIPPKLSL